MFRFATAFVLTATMLAGCSSFPELDDAISPAARAADYPTLKPIDQVINGAHDVQITEQSIATLQGRVNRLKARAARLRRPVIDATTRARMRSAIKRRK